MKRVCLTLFLAFVAAVAYAQDLSEDQIALRQGIIDKLNLLQLKPEIDIDGTVFFQKDGNELYVSVDPEVTTRPFLLSMYYGSSYDSGDDARVTKKNLEIALPDLNNDLSRVKVVIEDEYYLVSSEMYAASAVAIEKMIDDISFAVGKIKSDYLNDIVGKRLEQQMEIDKIKKDATVPTLSVSVPVLSDSIATVLGSDTVHFNMILVKGYHDATSGKVYDYRIGETEVTQRLWLAVMEDNPSCHKQVTFSLNTHSKFKRTIQDLPIENVSYAEVMEFLKKLNALTDEKYNLRLPDCNEWLFAARGGNKGEGTVYSGSDEYKSVCVCNADETKPVRSKKCNELGIYDMSGNVFEWCSDGPNDNPKNKFAVGGGYKTDEGYCRLDHPIESKSMSEPQGYVGFRIVMDVKK